MATFRVPQNDAQLPPVAYTQATAPTLDGPSRTQPPGGYETSTTNGIADASRRNSVDSQVNGAGMQPMYVQNGATNGVDPKAAVPIAAATNGKTRRRVIVDDHEKKGWSRGRKICCAILCLGLAAIITLGVLVAFMVRTPTVEYQSAEVLCRDNDYLRCVQDEVQVRVLLNIDNPNIIGARANAELGLFKEDKTFLGPGVIEDTDISASGVTPVVALFNITSERAYDILVQLFIPPTRDVPVLVDGTVFIHLGALRPSIGFQETFTIPAQNLGDTVGDLIGDNLPDGIPGISAGQVGDVIVENAPDEVGGVPVKDTIDTVGGAAGAVGDAADAVGVDLPSAGDLANLIPRNNENTNARDTRASMLARISHRQLFRRRKVGQKSPNIAQRVSPRRFAEALKLLGPPNSPMRQQLETPDMRQRREAARERPMQRVPSTAGRRW